MESETCMCLWFLLPCSVGESTLWPRLSLHFHTAVCSLTTVQPAYLILCGYLQSSREHSFLVPCPAFLLESKWPGEEWLAHRMRISHSSRECQEYSARRFAIDMPSHKLFRPPWLHRLLDQATLADGEAASGGWHLSG